MTSVGIRELRQRASALLRLVRAGETVEITDHGEPVAVLAPIVGRGPLERLRASGDVTAAAGDLEDLPEPIALVEGHPAPSEVLARLRDD